MHNDGGKEIPAELILTSDMIIVGLSKAEDKKKARRSRGSRADDSDDDEGMLFSKVDLYMSSLVLTSSLHPDKEASKEGQRFFRLQSVCSDADPPFVLQIDMLISTSDSDAVVRQRGSQVLRVSLGPL